MLGILPFGTPKANAINYQMLNASICVRRDTALTMLWKIARTSDKACIITDAFDRTAHDLLQSILKELKRSPSDGSISSYILPSFSDSVDGIKVASIRGRDILKSIYNRSIEEKWEKVFCSPHDTANNAILQASKEESELKEVEDRMRAEEKSKKLAIIRANKMEVAALTEKNSPGQRKKKADPEGRRREEIVACHAAT